MIILIIIVSFEINYILVLIFTALQQEWVETVLRMYLMNVDDRVQKEQDHYCYLSHIIPIDIN
jgi:hypothetical protein